MRRFEKIDAETKSPMEYHLFDSVTEMVEDARKVTEWQVETYLAGNSINQPKFVGRKFGSIDKAAEAANHTWAAGIEVLERMLRDVGDASLPKPVSRRRKMRWDESNGDELDNDRLRSGQDYWRTSRRQSTRGPATITVLVDIGANCGVGHEDILWRGAAAVALTKILEEAGYRVNLWAVYRIVAGYVDDTGSFAAYELKRPGDALDVSTLINAVSGWYLRTIGFASQIRSTKGRASYSHLGRCVAPTDENLDEVSLTPQRILIKDAFTYADAVRALRAAIEQVTR